MIEIAKKEEKATIIKMWEEAFAFDDGGFSDFFFAEAYKHGKHFVLKEDEIIACLSVFKATYSINDKWLKVSMIVGVTTKKEKRGQGHMKKLLNRVIRYLKTQDLVTFIQAYNPQIYKAFGFETIYYRYRYHFKKAEFKWLLNVEQNDILKGKDINNEDLLYIYAKFCKHFNGFKVRDLAYYDSLKKQLEYENGYILALRNDEKIIAYAIYYIYDKHLLIDECIYLDLKALCAILSILFKEHQNIDLLVSSNEKLYRFFKDIKYEIEDYTMARINDLDLFNELYKSEVKDVHEAFALSDKPLYMREIL